MQLIAVDPGDVHVGVARFFGKRFYESFETDPVTVLQYLTDKDFDEVVVESYKFHPGSSFNAYSDLPTVRLIGAIAYACAIKDKPIVMQDSTILAIIKKTPYYKKAEGARTVPRSPHAASAFCHGLYRTHLSPARNRYT